ncbi:tetratricopeptide repeat protein [Altererythrobacter sp. MF3-039]|uniref:tetratricopeptide repeat protein n=1 Tax=Altererythrobacter sp. MF3-039 TaxID=3252901 RepID=UPI00390C4DCB
MALKPTSNSDPEDKRAKALAAQDDALLREVDDAYRQGQYSEFADKYGKPLLGVIVLGLAAFGGYLYWDSEQEAVLEANSEQIVAALDQIEAGNFDTGVTTLEGVADVDSPGASAVARLLQASVSSERGNTAQAKALFAEVAADENAPEQLRNLALVRELALSFDETPPAEVISRLKPLAVPGNPWFGSAGELVAMAYLGQGQDQQAGTLFAEIAKSEELPDSLRDRSRRMAGLLGVDAVDNVDDLLADQDVASTAASAAQ